MGKVTVIAKREILYSGPFGLAAWLCGLVFINKRDVTESRELMKVAMEKLKRENIKLWVFPEGEFYLKIFLKKIHSVICGKKYYLLT